MTRAGIIGVAGVAAAALAVPMMPDAAPAACGVLSTRPCTPGGCSVFHHLPCVPEVPYPFGEGLRLTIQSRDEPASAPTKPLDTIQELFAALRACWAPPPIEQSRPGTQITIRFSLNRAGQIIGEPRFTYSTPTLPTEVKSAYQHAVAEMLSRCAPFPLTAGLGGAIAGQPISARFIDNRGLHRTENTR